MLHAYCLSTFFYYLCSVIQNYPHKKNTQSHSIMKKIILACAIILGSIPAMATQLIITTNTSTNIAHDIATIGKWVFVDNSLQLWDKDGNILASEELDNIPKIIFGEGVVTSVENCQKQHISIYPNPAHETLIINGIESQPLRVFDMQGNMVLNKVGTEINVTSLPNGTYLLQVGAQVVRFIKK